MKPAPPSPDSSVKEEEVPWAPLESRVMSLRLCFPIQTRGGGWGASPEGSECGRGQVPWYSWALRVLGRRQATRPPCMGGALPATNRPLSGSCSRLGGASLPHPSASGRDGCGAGPEARPRWLGDGQQFGQAHPEGGGPWPRVLSWEGKSEPPSWGRARMVRA